MVPFHPLDPRDPLLQSERMQGFAADPVYAEGEVFAYVGLPQNLKNLKDWHPGLAGKVPCAVTPAISTRDLSPNPVLWVLQAVEDR